MRPYAQQKRPHCLCFVGRRFWFSLCFASNPGPHRSSVASPVCTFFMAAIMLDFEETRSLIRQFSGSKWRLQPPPPSQGRGGWEPHGALHALLFFSGHRLVAIGYTPNTSYPDTQPLHHPNDDVFASHSIHKSNAKRRYGRGNGSRRCTRIQSADPLPSFLFNDLSLR